MVVLTLSPRFLACMPFILQEEGGYSDDPHDSGGETMQGIIQREYDVYRRSHGLPLQWVKLISVDERNEIYWNSYWLPHCPFLPAGLDLSFFNIAVNAGPMEAIRLLQEALGIESDGDWGPLTNRAVVNIALDSIPSLIKSFATDEEHWYEGLSKFQYFGHDWLGRAQRCETLSLTMAQQGEATS